MLFLAFLVAPVFQIVSIGTQFTEAIAGLERTREILREQPEDEDPRRTVAMLGIAGDLAFEHVELRLRRRASAVLHDVSFELRPRHGDGAGRAVRVGQVHHHRPGGGVPWPTGAAACSSTAWTWPRCGSIPIARSSASCCRKRSCSTARSARTSPSRGPEPARTQILRACRIARVDEFAEKFPEAVRHAGRRARRQALRRAAAARLDRARHPGRSAHPDPRRGHLQPRFRVRGADPGRAGATSCTAARRSSSPTASPPSAAPSRSWWSRSGRIVERGTHQAALRRSRPLFRALHQAARPGGEPVPGSGRGRRGGRRQRRRRAARPRPGQRAQ